MVTEILKGLYLGAGCILALGSTGAIVRNLSEDLEYSYPTSIPNNGIASEVLGLEREINCLNNQYYYGLDNGVDLFLSDFISPKGKYCRSAITEFVPSRIYEKGDHTRQRITGFEEFLGKIDSPKLELAAGLWLICLYIAGERRRTRLEQTAKK